MTGVEPALPAWLSIHALLTEGDAGKVRIRLGQVDFQSTPSSRRATRNRLSCTREGITFNPRPPHGGRLNEEFLDDAATLAFNPRPPHGGRLCQASQHWHFGAFNPRPPHGGRRTMPRAPLDLTGFQSTPSSRRATRLRVPSRSRTEISIHALLTEGDFFTWHTSQCIKNISIHALLTEGDLLRSWDHMDVLVISIHALLTEGDPWFQKTH